MYFFGGKFKFLSNIQNHAIETHPMCFVLFGHAEVVIQEVTIDDQKSQFYIEVKAEEVPSKQELATALASIEDQNEGFLDILPRF